ncbi:EutN/CcmL family microcompartment protein [Coraliomargarita parva]|uniref:EutN/CcmL family microcompartment protein n=1 Tax=Coraliomargarita parva TaxID=3014050 RepID=UPI0022B2D530|nr:EutN/CcmL family microcompartment protein [Coraliomargarita parva]
MLLARVDGHATASIGHPSLKGQKIVLCTPIDENGKSAGSPFAAIDPIGAGRHSKVFITTDGTWTQGTVHDETSPIRNQVMGIID